LVTRGKLLTSNHRGGPVDSLAIQLNQKPATLSTIKYILFRNIFYITFILCILLFPTSIIRRAGVKPATLLQTSREGSDDGLAGVGNEPGGSNPTDSTHLSEKFDPQNRGMPCLCLMDARGLSINRCMRGRSVSLLEQGCCGGVEKPCEI